MKYSQNKRFVLRLFGAILCVLAAAWLPAGDRGAGAAERVRLHAAFPVQLPLAGSFARRFVDGANRAAPGELRMRLFEPGALLPRFGYLDAVARGSVDAAWGTPAVAGGRKPALALFTGMPFGLDMAAQRAWMAGEGGRLYRDFYAELGVHGLPCAQLGGRGAGWFRKPLERPEDLAGLRLRSFGLPARTLERLGAQIAVLWGGDLYVALQTGTVDGAESGVPYTDLRQGLHQVAAVYHYPGWQMPASLLDVTFGSARWQALAPSVRRAVEAACAEGLEASAAEDERQRAAALAEIAAAGVAVLPLPEAVVAALAAAWRDLAAADAAADPDVARVLEAVDAFRRRR